MRNLPLQIKLEWAGYFSVKPLHVNNVATIVACSQISALLQFGRENMDHIFTPGRAQQPVLCDKQPLTSHVHVRLISCQ